jgi:hypothetical protein
MNHSKKNTENKHHIPTLHHPTLSVTHEAFSKHAYLHDPSPPLHKIANYTQINTEGLRVVEECERAVEVMEKGKRGREDTIAVELVEEWGGQTYFVYLVSMSVEASRGDDGCKRLQTTTEGVWGS